MPDADCGKHIFRFQVKIVSRCMDILSLDMPELDARIGFIGAFIFRKTDIPVNPEQRPADGSGICSEMLADLFQERAKVRNKAYGGTLDVFLISLFVFLEPLPVVILRQIF